MSNQDPQAPEVTGSEELAATAPSYAEALALILGTLTGAYIPRGAVNAHIEEQDLRGTELPEMRSQILPDMVQGIGIPESMWWMEASTLVEMAELAASKCGPRVPMQMAEVLVRVPLETYQGLSDYQQANPHLNIDDVIEHALVEFVSGSSSSWEPPPDGLSGVVEDGQG